MPQVLLVDDDQELCELLSTWLQHDGFAVQARHSCQAALSALSEGLRPEVLVLDVMLPDGNGLELLKTLRQRQHHTPVIMLSARGEPLDRILGLELGADDYLPKPCDPRELSARLKAILRRSQAILEPAATTNPSAGDLTLLTTRGLALVREQEVELTPTESELLAALLQEPGAVISKEDLSQQVLGKRLMPYDRSLDVHISNLRKKLGPNAEGQPRLQAVRGRGYRYLV